MRWLQGGEPKDLREAMPMHEGLSPADRGAIAPQPGLLFPENEIVSLRVFRQMGDVDPVRLPDGVGFEDIVSIERVSESVVEIWYSRVGYYERVEDEDAE